MDTRFGPSAPGLLQRLRRTPVTVQDLRHAAADVLPALHAPSLRVRIVERPAEGPVMLLEEDERRLRVRLAELADAMTRAAVPPTHDRVCAALSSWVAHRPVSDDAAATQGIAVLDWADPGETTLGWKVVVVRGELALSWQPSAEASEAAVLDTRTAAVARSAAVPLELRVEGPVALFSHSTVPLLATAALLEPERMLARVATAGPPMPDMHVVVTPRRPVACAGPGVAARLAGDTSEPCRTLPWRRLADLPW
jgi:hypothetical protein